MVCIARIFPISPSGNSKTRNDTINGFYVSISTSFDICTFTFILY